MGFPARRSGTIDGVGSPSYIVARQCCTLTGTLRTPPSGLPRRSDDWQLQPRLLPTTNPHRSRPGGLLLPFLVRHQPPSRSRGSGHGPLSAQAAAQNARASEPSASCVTIASWGVFSTSSSSSPSRIGTCPAVHHFLIRARYALGKPAVDCSQLTPESWKARRSRELTTFTPHQRSFANSSLEGNTCLPPSIKIAVHVEMAVTIFLEELRNCPQNYHSTNEEG